MKLRQAEEMVRISAKHNDDPLKADFDKWIAGDRPVGSKPCVLHLLMSRFRAICEKVEYDNTEKAFKYCKDMMGLMKVNGIADVQNFKTSKDIQEKNTRQLIQQIRENEIVIFTDGSALGNPGPTGAGAVVYLNGYHFSSR